VLFALPLLISLDLRPLHFASFSVGIAGAQLDPPGLVQLPLLDFTEARRPSDKDSLLLPSCLRGPLILLRHLFSHAGSASSVSIYRPNSFSSR
jgi:hypothetical protein